MTTSPEVASGTRALRGRCAELLVPLCCGVLAALGAAAAPWAVVGVWFAPVMMVPVTLLLLVAGGFVNATILRSVTGRRRSGLAVVLTLLVPVAVGVELVAQGEIPFSPRLGLPVPLLIGAVVAGVSCFAFRGWGRAVGVVTVLAVVVPSAWRGASDTVDDAAAARSDEATAREAAYDDLLPGATTTLPDVETDLRTLTATTAEVAVDRDGRGLVVSMSAWGSPHDDDPDGFACWLLVGDESWVPGQTAAELEDRCRILDEGWAGADGLIFGTYRHGYWVTVHAGASATAEDVTAVATTLADVPEAERRARWERDIGSSTG